MKILFLLPSFGIGGTTVSTRNLIMLLEKRGHECWAMPLHKKGLLCDLYDGVPQIQSPFVVHALANGSWKEEPTALRRLGAMLIRFTCNHSSRVKKYLVKTSIGKQISSKQFDVIVACQEGISTALVSCIKHPEKIAWVRCDYRRIYETRGKEPFYETYKAVVCVAEETCEYFKTVYPEYSDRVFCIPNPQDSDFIITRSKAKEEEPRFRNDKTKLVSIGRLDEIKRFTEIPHIAKQLIAMGLDFTWYVIGDGAERQHIADEITKCDMGEYVVMLGAKSNPYYYISQAKLLVSLSRSEACPRVVNEAKILGTPTISTDYPTIFEFIENGKNGWIAPLENIPETIHNALSDNTAYQGVCEELKEFTFNSNPLVDKIEQLMMK